MPDRIGIDEHVTISGITGGGKSVLTRMYLSQMPAVIKLDIKGEAFDDLAKKKSPWPEVDPKKLAIVETLKDLSACKRPYIIYCPVLDEMEPDAYNEFFKFVYTKKRNKNTVTWIDEIMEVCDSHNIPRYLKALYTRGRSRHTPVWGLTQRPVGIHPLCFSQSTHVFSFDLQLDQDRKKVAEMTGCREFLDNPNGYNFWYYRRGFRNASKGVIQL